MHCEFFRIQRTPFVLSELFKQISRFQEDALLGYFVDAEAELLEADQWEFVVLLEELRVMRERQTYVGTLNDRRQSVFMNVDSRTLASMKCNVIKCDAVRL